MRWHEGIDIGAREGSPVYAVLAGTVLHAVIAGTAHFGGYGNCVCIAHDGGLWSLYAHMQHPPMVERGQRIEAGAQLGQVGGTESSQAQSIPVHLHNAWAVRPWPKHYDEASVNPELIYYTLGLAFSPSGLSVAARTPGLPEENPTQEQRTGRMGARSGRSSVIAGSRLACRGDVAVIAPPSVPAADAPALPAPVDFRPTMPRSVQVEEVASTAGPLAVTLVALAAGALLVAGAKTTLRASAMVNR